MIQMKTNINPDILLKYGFLYNNEKDYYIKNINSYRSYYTIKVNNDRNIDIYKLNEYDTECNSWYDLDCEELLLLFHKLLKDNIIEIS